MLVLSRRQWLGLTAMGAVAGCRRAERNTRAPARIPYPAFRRAHPSALVRPAPRPAPFDNAALDSRFDAVRWPGPAGQMRGWLHMPSSSGPVAGLLWLHGAFAVSAAQFEPLGAAFPPRDIAVFVPAWRGENGNPGERELLTGELDDAIAALAWFAEQPGVDGGRLAAFGHSVGGALSALLALMPDVPLRETASVGGIYVPETFARWAKTTHNGPLVRFDPHDPAEGRLRTLAGNMPDLARPHVAYVGRDDTWFHPNIERMREAAAQSGAPFQTEYVPGDHMGSLAHGYTRYLARARGVLS